MQLKQVKAFMNKVVYYDTGQMNIEGCSIQEFILTACVLRHDKKRRILLSSRAQRCSLQKFSNNSST